MKIDSITIRCVVVSIYAISRVLRLLVRLLQFQKPKVTQLSLQVYCLIL